MSDTDQALLAEALEALERVGCQFTYCDGPTLEPEPMVTCFVCELLARLRVALGQQPRRDYEMTCEEYDQARHARYMREATSHAG